MAPSRLNGKICYVEIPATDIARSSAFYAAVFGWKLRKRRNGTTAFDDATGQVSGTWVLGRPPSGAPSVSHTTETSVVAPRIAPVPANGAASAHPIGVDAPEIPARFCAPGGNVIGLYHPPE